MQQLSFLDPPPQQGAVPVWEALDDEQRASLVLRLARLIAKAIAISGDRNDERAEQEALSTYADAQSSTCVSPARRRSSTTVSPLPVSTS
jgi:hypothetical protein